MHLVRCVLFHFLGKRRTRPHQTHGTVQYIEKLRQFVQTGFPQKSADRCDTGILFHLKDRTVCLIQSTKLLQLLFGIHAQGAELVHSEKATVLGHPQLLEDRVVEVLQKDCQCDQQHGHAQHDHCQK